MRRLLFLALLLISIDLQAQPPLFEPVRPEEEDVFTLQDDTLSMSSYADMNYNFVSLSFSMIVPRASFERAIGKNAYGFSLLYGHKYDGLPIVLGGDLAFHWYDSFSFDSPFSDNEDQASFQIINPSMYLRFQSEDELFIPYFEIVGGFSLISTTFTYDTGGFWDDDADSDVEASVSWNYGLGAGVMIPFILVSESFGPHLLFDMSARLMFGSNVNFINNRSLSYDEGFIYSWQNSDTPHFALRFGFTLR